MSISPDSLDLVSAISPPVSHYEVGFADVLRGRPQRIRMELPQHTNGRFVVSFDAPIYGCPEIAWTVSRNNRSPALLTRKLSNQGLWISGTSTLYWDLSDEDSQVIGQTGSLYQECRMSLPTGSNVIAFFGRFRHRNMILGD